MSDQSDDDDKPFEPSQKKLDDAREKGEFPKSADLTTAAAYGGFAIALAAMAGQSLSGIGQTLAYLLDQSDVLAAVILTSSAQPLLGGIVGAVAVAALPWVVFPAVGAILSTLGQQAFVVAPQKISPKLSRLSLLQGAKTKFGREGLFEFAKSFVKLAIYSVLLGYFLMSRLDDIVATISLSPGMIVVEIGRLTLSLLLTVVGISLALGVVDLLWQRSQHARKHRMTRQELLDEQKQQDGDPMVKQQRRQRAIDLAMNKMLADVPTASVVIVNPLHYAVALHWPGDAGHAPVCVAKGVDEIAARIREVAAEHGVPIHPDPPTARALHAAVAIGQEIAPDQYRAVAVAIRFSQTMRSKMRRST
ncbi:flagellar biosynthetic protein FlhB [Loktanella fryxellensis]|uniref:Flagellar biosynthetic protein FlhB n=1 Tax=Loktanella fryxellensis TaxID=245187 RepID=A0A1H7ZQ11_9RHOB|nr:flagellar type III secretion system protein FlhB [Loktanella fryxellensis]SEM60475.1 flagellar biosynthetic protein FlhB [Loktanella fryxellensis]